MMDRGRGQRQAEALLRLELGEGPEAEREAVAAWVAGWTASVVVARSGEQHARAVAAGWASAAAAGSVYGRGMVAGLAAAWGAGQ